MVTMKDMLGFTD